LAHAFSKNTSFDETKMQGTVKLSMVAGEVEGG
jgi:hypothetical protein